MSLIIMTAFITALTTPVTVAAPVTVVIGAGEIWAMAITMAGMMVTRAAAVPVGMEAVAMVGEVAAMVVEADNKKPFLDSLGSNPGSSDAA